MARDNLKFLFSAKGESFQPVVFFPLTLYLGMFIRGLFEAWLRAPDNSSIKNFIQGYITVQVRF